MRGPSHYHKAKGEKGIKIETEDVKLSLFTDGMTTFLYRNTFPLIAIYSEFHLFKVFFKKKHEMPKIFTLKTSILLRENEDLNK